MGIFISEDKKLLQLLDDLRADCGVFENFSRMSKENLDLLLNEIEAMVSKNNTRIVSRYYRSGLEMVRMANVYLDEGSLENAFILYMKFMTLFIEKIRTHPDFNSVSSTEKYINSQKLKEVFPKAEKLKSRLLERYTVEYDRYLKDEKRKQEAARAKKQLLENLKKEKGSTADIKTPRASHPPASLSEPFSKLHITPVPNITGDLYPNEALDVESKPSPVKPQHLSVATPRDMGMGPGIPLPSWSLFMSASSRKKFSQLSPPSASDLVFSATDLLPAPRPSVNRSTKPANLLSPTVNLPHSKLRTVVVPGNLIKQFISLAQRNTDRNIETCGILAGQLKKDELVITHLLIPQQTGSSDACDTQREEDLFDFQDQHDLITFGWIHTHPTQTAFLSSVDLHTHCSYQRMMPEAIAIVCAPRYSENKFFYLTPDYGLDFIANCQKKGFHPHPTEPELYAVAGHIKTDSSSSVKVVDLRITKN